MNSSEAPLSDAESDSLEEAAVSRQEPLRLPADDRVPEDLFPLPLTPFERLMFDDDHPKYPRIFVVVVQLSGELQKAAFEQSVQAVIRRNPLLSATIKNFKSKPHWVPASFPAHHLTWGEHAFEQENTTFDLRTTPGFRVSGKSDGTTSEIRLVFHHAVTDGHGTRRVIIDILSHYAAVLAPDAQLSSIECLNYERLKERGQVVLKAPPVRTEAPSPITKFTISQRLKTIYDFFSQQPTAIRPGSARIRQKEPHDNRVAHTLTYHLNMQEINRSRDQLRGTRITLNDLSIALLLNTIARWNRSHGETGKDRLYRILVPVDLREPEDELLPAANRLSLVFITRHTGLCLDLPQLIPTIRAEMDYIDEHGLKPNLLKALPVVQAIPGLIPMGARLPLCLSTAVLTNMGDVMRKLRHRFPSDDGRIVFGNLKVIHAGGAPPLRYGTGLGIGLTMSNGAFFVQGQFDTRLFTQSDAEEFMSSFIETWRSWKIGG